MKQFHKPLTAIILIFVFSFFTACSSSTLPFSKQEQTTTEKVKLYGAYKVLRIVDGDTFVADIDGTQTKIRLIGVDTPESVHPDSSRNSDEGKTASEYTKSLLENKNVYLEYDVSRNDKYGRTLAYVYLDENTMLQDLLLQNGYAQIMTIQPNSKYADKFYAEQQIARENAKGFWKDYFVN